MGCSMGPKSATPWPPYRLTKGRRLGKLVKQLDNLLYGKADEKTQIHHARRNAQSR